MIRKKDKVKERGNTQEKPRTCEAVFLYCISTTRAKCRTKMKKTRSAQSNARTRGLPRFIFVRVSRTGVLSSFHLSYLHKCVAVQNIFTLNIYMEASRKRATRHIITSGCLILKFVLSRIRCALCACQTNQRAQQGAELVKLISTKRCVCLTSQCAAGCKSNQSVGSRALFLLGE